MEELAEEPEMPGPNVYSREAKIGLAVAVVFPVSLFLHTTKVMHP